LKAGVIGTFEYKFLSGGSGETYDIGRMIGKQLKRGDIVCLMGELGTGKTMLTKGLAAGSGVKDYVTSPSFKLINEYKGRIKFYHFDLYRLSGISDVAELGYREYFYGNGITVIEWAGKMRKWLPEQRIDVFMAGSGETLRRIRICSPRELKIKKS